MPGNLKHSPADVVRQLLVDLSHAIDPSDSGDWQAFTGLEPQDPDDVITVYDTAGISQLRDNPTGQRDEQHGIQIRVRSGTPDKGWDKIQDIAVALDADVSFQGVKVGSTFYTVVAITRTSTVFSLGREESGQRFLFTVNATTSMYQNS